MSFTTQDSGVLESSVATAAQPATLQRKIDWTGALVAIVDGHGVGQWSTVKSWSGQQVDLSIAFGIAPDGTRMAIAPRYACLITDTAAKTSKTLT